MVVAGEAQWERASRLMIIMLIVFSVRDSTIIRKYGVQFVVFPIFQYHRIMTTYMYSMQVLFLLSRPASIHHQSLCILLVSVPKKKLFAKKGLQTIHIVSKSLKRPGTGPRSHHRLFRYVNVFACVTVICQHPSTIMVVAKVVGTEFQFASHSE